MKLSVCVRLFYKVSWDIHLSLYWACKIIMQNSVEKSCMCEEFAVNVLAS